MALVWSESVPKIWACTVKSSISSYTDILTAAVVGPALVDICAKSNATFLASNLLLLREYQYLTTNDGREQTITLQNFRDPFEQRQKCARSISQFQRTIQYI